MIPHTNYFLDFTGYDDGTILNEIDQKCNIMVVGSMKLQLLDRTKKLLMQSDIYTQFEEKFNTSRDFR